MRVQVLVREALRNQSERGKVAASLVLLRHERCSHLVRHGLVRAGVDDSLHLSGRRARTRPVAEDLMLLGLQRARLRRSADRVQDQLLCMIGGTRRCALGRD